MKYKIVCPICEGRCVIKGTRNWVAQGWVEAHCWHCIDGWVEIDDEEVLPPPQPDITKVY